MELQPEWTRHNTPAMQERGQLVRREVRDWLSEHRTALAAAIGIPDEDFFPEGRDATGLKTRVPWTRYGSRDRTPSATDGFYVVYLWAFDGSAVYLSLNQGTTDFINGDNVDKPAEVLSSRVAWARDVVAGWITQRDDLIPLDLADEGPRAQGYQRGDIASIRYPLNGVPDDEQLLADAVSFAGALGQLYKAHSRGPLPFEVPEVVELEDAADDAAGNKRPSRGAGFRPNAAERVLIEKHAEDMAVEHYSAGWHVKRVGAYKPYDLELTRPHEKWTVEVKGTTSMGEAIPLTAGEVRHHARAYPDNALVVVRGITLDRSTSPATVSGGQLYERQPWDIAEDALRVISYHYTVPPDLYLSDQGIDAGPVPGD